MSAPQVIRFHTADALAEEAARRFLQEIGSATSHAPRSVALSGGRIAKTFFAQVARLAGSISSRQALEVVEFFWADERCVGPTDPESNFKLAQDHLFSPLQLALRGVHRIRGELAPELAASEAEAEISRIVPLDDQGQPVLELVLLGMGEDGHIASLFPGEPDALVHSTKSYRAVVGPKPPPRRVTMSYACLAAARNVWVLASGAGKEEALKRSLQKDGGTPLGRLLSLRGETTIFSDL